MSAAPPGARSAHDKRTLAAGMVGNVIEWYDFTLYGYLAVILSQVFFPSQDPTASLIATYGVFAAGFVMRPLGGVLFGHLGDTLGRKPVLMISVAMMVLPTLLLGVLPTYADWGIWASISLLAIRLVQGLSVGGEFSGSVTYLVETAPANKRGFAASWANMGSAFGMLLGAGTPALTIWILGHEETAAWGWRIPFLLGGLLGIGALLLRRGLPEVPEKRKKVRSSRQDHPIVSVFRLERATLAKVMLFCCGYGIFFYIPFVYLPSWLALYTKIELHQALFIATLGIALQVCLIPWLAHLSDRWIRRTHLLSISYFVTCLATIPLYAWSGSGSLWVANLVILTFSVLIAVSLATAPATLAEAFDRPHRLTGYSLAFNSGIGIAGGTAPMIATWLIHETGMPLVPAYYLAIWALIGGLAILSLKDRSREPLR